MNVIKSDGTIEDFDINKVKRGVKEAYSISSEKQKTNEVNDVISEVEKLVESYDEISSNEIRRIVENALVKRNFNAGRQYILHWAKREATNQFVIDKERFISKYKASSNNADATIDDNSNANGKNISLINAEIHKSDNVLVSRGMITRKLKELYPKFNPRNYIKDLEKHIIYKHDESSFAGAIAPYTYSAKEVVTVNYNGHVLLTPFDSLWELMTEEEVLVDEINEVYQKYPSNLKVLDSNGWTEVTHVTKKLRHRDLVRVKTSFGEDVVVTDNHPMIVSSNVDDTVEAINSLGKPQFKIHNDEGIFQTTTEVVDMSNCPITSEHTDSYCFNQNEFTNCWCKRKVNLDWKLGYFVGYFVGDGNYDNTKDDIHFTQKNRGTLLKLNSIIYDALGVAGRIYTKKDLSNCYVLNISSDYLHWLLKDYFKIQDKSSNKTLPLNIYETNAEFAKGVLCGLIDADGTVNGCQLSIRLSSRSAVLQCTHLLRYFGYGVGNVNQSLPFSNNTKYKTNYTLWGVNCSVRENSTDLGPSDKLKNVRVSSSSLKYNRSGETKIVKVTKLSENDSFVNDNKYIYDITTKTHTFVLNSLLVHNCCSITMYPFLLNGIENIGGLSAAPKNIDSFCGMYCNLLFVVASQFAGAVATPEVLVFFDYYARKEWGDDYYLNADKNISCGDNVKRIKTIRMQIHQYWQQMIYTINQPASSRNGQSCFINFSYFDKPFFESMFGNFYFPDGTQPTWNSINWLQKEFMMWFNEERTKCLLTFPVESFALIYKDGEFVDKENAKFVADELARGHSFFIYTSDTADSLSSCCRLKNKIQTREFSFTNGNIGVETGSKSVITINLNRITQDFCKKEFGGRPKFVEFSEENLANYKKYLIKILERIYKYHNAYNELLWDMYNSNLLPVYKAGFIDLNKQYLTIGINGLNQSAEYLGLECHKNEQYSGFCRFIFGTIKDENEKHKTKRTTFNTEQVPAESLAIKNYNWDKEDGYWVPEDTNLYASYIFKPNDEDSVLDKMYMMSQHFATDYLDGGAAAHINMSEHLTSEQNYLLLEYAAKIGCNYWTINVPNSKCECGFITKKPIHECPKCGSTNIEYYDRVIGYLTKISNWSEGRRIEQKTRKYLDKDKIK